MLNNQFKHNSLLCYTGSANSRQSSAATRVRALCKPLQPGRLAELDEAESAGILPVWNEPQPRAAVRLQEKFDAAEGGRKAVSSVGRGE